MTKEEAIKVLDKIPFCRACDENVVDLDCDQCKEALAVIRKTLQQPGIVRCKDCKHRPIILSMHSGSLNLSYPDSVCVYKDSFPPDNWFCAYGERN